MRLNHGYHNTLYVPRCLIFSYSLFGTYVWLFSWRKKARLYEGWTLLYFFAYFLLSLGSLNWKYMGLSLSGIWYLNLDSQLSCWWEHLLNIHLKIQYACCLYWNLVINFYMGSIFGWILTYHTGCIDDWCVGRIFGWIITGGYTWIPTWISKSWSCAWLFVWIYVWHDPWYLSCKLYWIPAWIYLAYQLVWSLDWQLALQLCPFFALKLT